MRMLATIPRAYALVAMAAGYLLVLLASPVRLALRDGLRCLARYPRVWLSFAALSSTYALFQWFVLEPSTGADYSFRQFPSWADWGWPGIGAALCESLLPAALATAGLFDNAVTTFPLSTLAAVLLIVNWRGLHGSLFTALRKRYRAAGYLIYFAVLIGAFATFTKALLYWRLPTLAAFVLAPRLLHLSALVDTLAFMFEYLCGIYLQVYLITVCLGWVKGLNFGEGALFRFAMRRFSYVFQWAVLVLLVSIFTINFPILLAFYVNLPWVGDYLFVARWVLAGAIVSFSTIQISLSLHNETLGAAFRAHGSFLAKHWRRFAWFLAICAFHFLLLTLLDTSLKTAAEGRSLVLLTWRCVHLLVQSFLIGWLLASWVCLYRQCEMGKVSQESWVAY